MHIGKVKNEQGMGGVLRNHFVTNEEKTWKLQSYNDS